MNNEYLLTQSTSFKKLKRYLFIALLIIFPLLFLGSILFGPGKTDANNPNSKLLPAEINTINVFENVVRSVVGITNIQIADSWYYGEQEVPAGAGSGFVWDDQGHIITNYHVIRGGDKFTITFYRDTKQYKAKLVGVEPSKDIAILKLTESPKKIYPLAQGTSKSLRVGQTAMAVGNPFHLNHTITKGIVSALDRRIPGVTGLKIYGMIQTDASVNPGNSGGPLVNSTGEVIGMNTQIMSSSGSSAGIGFAVPIDTIKRLTPQLIKHGKVLRPMIGIAPISEQYVKDHFGIKKGVIIKYILPDGPAQKAGLRGMSKDNRGNFYLGDVILKISGKEVNSLEDIFNVLEQHKYGDTITVDFLREKRKMSVQLKLFQMKRRR